MKILLLCLLFFSTSPVQQRDDIYTQKKKFLKRYERTYLKKAKPVLNADEKEIDELIKAGNMAEANDDIKAAIFQYRKALDVNVTSPVIWYNMGCATFKMSNFMNAVIELTKAIDGDTLSAELFYARGNAYFKIKDYTKALSDYSTAVRLNSKDAACFYNRALTYFQLGSDSACADLISAKKLGDKKAAAMFISDCR